jgi:methionine sulfoxide reductase heme-binding subunit
MPPSSSSGCATINIKLARVRNFVRLCRNAASRELSGAARAPTRVRTLSPLRFAGSSSPGLAATWPKVAKIIKDPASSFTVNRSYVISLIAFERKSRHAGQDLALNLGIGNIASSGRLTFRRVMMVLKVGVHLLCLTPLLWVVRFCMSPRVFLNADPVKFIIHFTGDWAIYLLLASVSISLLGKLIAKDVRLIHFCRITGLYAFLYATLHLVMYFCVYSGYDFIAAFAGFHTGHAGVLLTEWNAVFPGVLDDFRKRPFLYLGLFGWALLLVASVTSQRFVQHALGGKKWQHLYRLTYVATFAAVIHLWFFLMGSVPASAGRCIDVFRTAFISSLAADEQRSQSSATPIHEKRRSTAIWLQFAEYQ